MATVETQSNIELVRVAEAAQQLALAKSTVYELLETGQLPYVAIGRARRIPRTAIDTFITQNLRGTLR